MHVDWHLFAGATGETAHDCTKQEVFLGNYLQFAATEQHTNCDLKYKAWPQLNDRWDVPCCQIICMDSQQLQWPEDITVRFQSFVSD